MIRLRPTQWANAVHDDAYTSGISVDPLRNRPPRYCACGTRLRRSQPMWVTRCDPCDAALARAMTVAELHPDKPPPVRPSYHTDCPDCDGKKHKHAQRCRSCRSKMIHARKHPVWNVS